MTPTQDKLNHALKLVTERAEIDRELLRTVLELLYESNLAPVDSQAPQAASTTHPLLTVNEFCDRARVSRATLYRMIQNRDVGYYKVGGRTLFDDKQLAEFLARHEVRSTQGSSD